MELEQLTKSQTVLLTLLVSFVTSIATGIVTVSLLDQAPSAVTQTINRVVERTIETVTQPTTPQGASVVTKETTVVVKEEDLITSSIESNLSSLVVLYQGTTTNPAVGNAVVVGNEGMLVADESVAPAEGTLLVTAGGKVLYEVGEVGRDKDYGLVFLAPQGTSTVPVKSVTLGATRTVKLGQTVLVLGSASRSNVSYGIVSGTEEVATAAADEKRSFIAASVNGKTPAPGSPLLNMFGEVIGISTGVSRSVGDHVYVPSERIALFLKEQTFVAAPSGGSAQ